ncbi:S-layer homology domain-containing protein [Tissierella sp.]|uniref:S-layer homology domain-containing protein n=1 Tax=Tissierella sp. TaxID=41274 RepID=UPI0028568C10|nr:S-layer homology domain-containing protein [Tissierella sp.]MDR7857588.1 S-layer homology domain-containing protein [Tissierella sp.]
MIRKKRVLSTLVTVIIIIGMLPFGVFAAETNDYDSSWAKTEINYMKEKGVLSGYPDGTFRPGNNMSKAEFYKVINGLMGFTNKSKVSFIDVKSTDWYYGEVGKGLAAKYLSNTVKLGANSKINREEVARIIGFVFGIEKDLATAKEFTDYDTLSEATRGVIGGLKKNGFISGYPDGTFRPKSEITRAEVVKMLNNITGEIVNLASTVNKNIKTNLLVNTGDVVLKDMVIEGNLYLTEGIRQGDITLDNVEIKGELAIKGGGANSIIINNSKINTVTVDRQTRLLQVEFENTRVEQIINLQDGKVTDIVLTKEEILDGILDDLEDGALNNIVYPGDDKDEEGNRIYILPSFVKKYINDFYNIDNIGVHLSNHDVGVTRGHHKVTLILDDASAERIIKTDTFTVDTPKGFTDILAYGINTIILDNNIEITGSIDNSGLKNIIFNGYKLIINGEDVNEKQSSKETIGKETSVKETRKLPEIYDTGKAKIVKIPAMPEKGFKWPYLLKIPSNTYKKSNADLPKRYLMFEMANTNEAKYDEMGQIMIERLELQQAASFRLAEKLWSPVMVPLYPRTHIPYFAEKDYTDPNFIFEHQFDRDSVMLEELLEDEFIREQLLENYSENYYNVEDFLDFDKQILAMIDHAIDYLNQYGHNVEDKILIGGDSASGHFSNRFATLYPERVKISSAGLVISGVMAAKSEYDGEKLMYPIGTYDYEKITGKKFDLVEHNKVARIHYFGKEDDHEALMPSDVYGDKERDIMIKLFGAHLDNPLQRIRNVNDFYVESGGKGIIVYMDKTGHDVSNSMEDYLLQFYRENLRSERPVYNLPKNPKGLEVEIYK